MLTVVVYLGQQLRKYGNEVCSDASPVLFLEFLVLHIQDLIPHKWLIKSCNWLHWLTDICEMYSCFVSYSQTLALNLFYFFAEYKHINTPKNDRIFVCHHLFALSSSNRWRHLCRLSDGAYHQLYERPLLLVHQTWWYGQVQSWVGNWKS